MFIGMTDAKVEAPVLWPSDGKNQLTKKKKNLMLERLKVKGDGAAEDGMVFRYHCQLNRHEFE